MGPYGDLRNRATKLELDLLKYFVLNEGGPIEIGSNFHCQPPDTSLMECSAM